MIVLPIELYSSKNSRRILKAGERRYIGKSEKAKCQEVDLSMLLNANRYKWLNMTADKKYPLNVGIYIYRRTKGRWDWVNIVQGMFDMMTKAGYFPDDDAKHLTPVFLGYSVDKNNPRVEITVL